MDVSQIGPNIHWSVPTSLMDPTINLYTSVVDFIYFRRLVELALKVGVPQAVDPTINLYTLVVDFISTGRPITLTRGIKWPTSGA